jgi:chromosome segregation ATPase
MRQTIKECNDIIKAQAKRIEELEAKAAKDQQHVAQQLNQINKLRLALDDEDNIQSGLSDEIGELRTMLFVSEDEVDALDQEILELKDQLENAQAIIVKHEQTILSLDGAVVELNQLCNVRYETITALQGDEKALRDYNQTLADTISDREGEITDLVNVNKLLREHLDAGVVIAEDTVDVLTKYQPCIHAYKEIHRLIERDTDVLHAVLDDAEFLDALYPRGGQNIRTLVRFILGLVP